MRVLATAGASGHGKSTVVRALTGSDADAPIDGGELSPTFGLSTTKMPGGTIVGLIDFPGRRRLVRTLLASGGTIGACLFVANPTDKQWQPAAAESLELLRHLGMRDGVIAISHAGSIDDDRRSSVRQELRELTTGTFLERADMVFVEATAEAGLDELRRAVERLAARTSTSRDAGWARLWIDRRLSPREDETVVTGTVSGTRMRVGDELMVLPGDQTVEIVGLLTAEGAVAVATPGERVAVSVRGVGHRALERGGALASANAPELATMVEVELDVLRNSAELSNRTDYNVYVGTGEQTARVELLDSTTAGPERKSRGRIHLSKPLPLIAGDAIAVLSAADDQILATGAVASAVPSLVTPNIEPAVSIDAALDGQAAMTIDELERITGTRVAANVGDRWVMTPEARAATIQRLRDAIGAAGADGIDLRGLSDLELALVRSLSGVEIDGMRVRGLGAAETTRAVLRRHPFVRALEERPLEPLVPETVGVPRAEVRDLVRHGLVVQHDNGYFSKRAIDDARDKVTRLLRASPKGVTTSAIGAAIGAEPEKLPSLLEHFDRAGITKRPDLPRRPERRIEKPLEAPRTSRGAKLDRSEPSARPDPSRTDTPAKQVAKVERNTPEPPRPDPKPQERKQQRKEEIRVAGPAIEQEIDLRQKKRALQI